jgi:DNA-binding NarL/FixJ family response regulator
MDALPAENGQCASTSLAGGGAVFVTDYETGLAIVKAAHDADVARERWIPKVMIVTQRDREAEIRHALEQGIQGYLLLGCRLEEMNDGVRALHRGLRHLGQAAARRIAESFSHQSLTDRECTVLRLLVAGCSNKGIALDLDIALGTVKAHVKAILGKLEAKTRTEAAAVAQRRGLFARDAERLDPVFSGGGSDRSAVFRPYLGD